jgi:hypothetical protein
MHYILIIIAFVWFAAVAPASMTFAAIAAWAMLSFVGARAVMLVTGARVETGEVLRSVGMAFVFAGMTLYGMYLMLNTIDMILVMIAVLVAYVLGFSIGLDVDFGHAFIIALITSVASGGVYYLVRHFLMPIF